MMDRFRIPIQSRPAAINLGPNSRSLPQIRYECIELVLSEPLLLLMIKSIQHQIDELECHGFEPRFIVLGTKCYEQLILESNGAFVQQYEGLDVVISGDSYVAIVTCDNKTEFCHAKDLDEIRERVNIWTETR